MRTLPKIYSSDTRTLPKIYSIDDELNKLNYLYKKLKTTNNKENFIQIYNNLLNTIDNLIILNYYTEKDKK